MYSKFVVLFFQPFMFPWGSWCGR